MMVMMIVGCSCDLMRKNDEWWKMIITASSLDSLKKSSNEPKIEHTVTQNPSYSSRTSTKKVVKAQNGTDQ